MFSSNTSQVSNDANYIEDVFSTYLYTGNGGTQTITNGIDLSTKGGLVWAKCRSTLGYNALVDTARGATKKLNTDRTVAQYTDATTINAFTASGFTMGSDSDVNFSSATFSAWTFRKQPKFFDVVTYTGDGTTARAISHNLGSAPACMFVRQTNTAADWRVYHVGCSANNALRLNSTDAQIASGPDWFGNSSTTIAPTATQFTINGAWTNVSGGTYVAYLFAHNAGGFGLTGTDNVISCGSYTGAGTSSVSVNLGYEPQWLLVKRATTSGQSWFLFDNMRGMPLSGTTPWLKANTSDAETAVSGNYVIPTATGFTIDPAGAYLNGVNTPGDTYIYIAIRRGPMKVPTSGTSVFSPNVEASTASPQTITTNFPVDLSINRLRTAGGNYVFDRLRGSSTTSFATLQTQATLNEQTGTGSGFGFDNNTGIVDNAWWNSTSAVLWNFRRAPSFFDEVCYTGTGVARTVTHNLGVAPELMIVKSRSLGTESWTVWNTTIAALNAANFLWLNSTSNIVTNSGRFNSTAPTSSVFTVGSDTSTNGSGSTYVAYLFATCAGVSKVGSYTGNGSSQTINCGFTGGARFVLIKRTDSTGDWYVWDTARGIVSGNDPHLSLNTTAAEVTTDDTIDPDNTGFIVNQLSATNVNVSSATYIYLAIA